jgi:hypothetical protein
MRARAARQVCLLLSALAGFCVAFLGQIHSAQAAPIGMCADTAQSIAAPPPMFPAKNSVLKNCEAEVDEGLLLESPGAPKERVSPSAEIPDLKVVLDSATRAFKVPSYLFPLEKASLELPEEHRWQRLRPPAC